MVDDAVLIFGVIVGVLATISYLLVWGVRREQRPQLHGVVIIFLSSTGIAAGFKVCIMSLDRAVLLDVDGDRLYIFLGGLCVIWVSFISLVQPFKEMLSSKPKKPQ